MLVQNHYSEYFWVWNTKNPSYKTAKQIVIRNSQYLYIYEVSYSLRNVTLLMCNSVWPPDVLYDFWSLHSFLFTNFLNTNLPGHTFDVPFWFFCVFFNVTAVYISLSVASLIFSKNFSWFLGGCSGDFSWDDAFDSDLGSLRDVMAFKRVQINRE